tara:strand:- start:104 stop:361 length:258 start_codon:yes stop_codon:yes gene_type:complete
MAVATAFKSTFLVGLVQVNASELFLVKGRTEPFGDGYAPLSVQLVNVRPCEQHFAIPLIKKSVFKSEPEKGGHVTCRCLNWICPA